MNRILHAVYAVGGSYDDAFSRVVALYEDRAVAEEHARLANEFMQARQAAFQEDYDYEKLTANPYDLSIETGGLYEADAKYVVVLLFVHGRPEQYQAEHAVLSDEAKMKGWPNVSES